VKFGKLATKYRGSVATSYEARRFGPKWAAEQEAAEALVRCIPPKSKVLDVPVGTGRLIPILASCGLLITGLDASPDMLTEARKRARSVGAQVTLEAGDIRKLPFAHHSFKLVSCLRFLNWIDIEGVKSVLQELSRVSSGKLLIGVRYLTVTGEMGLSPRALMWGPAAYLGLTSWRVERWGMVLHKRAEIESAFEKLNLTVIERRPIERRWDGTDYVFYFLEKRKT
jgi:SAM-dependent methyltransferase